MSPGLSLGVKLNGVRQFGQKPSARPGRPSRDRPTGLPHLAQKRRSSGTCGFARIALLGSIGGTLGIVVRPAPRRAPRSRVDDVPILRVVREPPARTEPSGVLASRFEAVIRDRVDAAAVSGESAWAGTTGAAPAGGPQTVQKPSSMTPGQPGIAHGCVPWARPAGGGGVGAPPGGAGGGRG